MPANFCASNCCLVERAGNKANFWLLQKYEHSSWQSELQAEKHKQKLKQQQKPVDDSKNIVPLLYWTGTVIGFRVHSLIILSISFPLW